jgi:molybdopterin-guanine dinucleotide biosynthesis protein A
MGADKALVRLEADGPALIERVIAVAREIAGGVAIIGPIDRDYQRFGVPVIADHYPGEGPLGGIATALTSSSTGQTMVLSCDHPFLSISLLRWISELPSAPALVPEIVLDGRRQRHPMIARYERSALGTIERLLAAGERRVQRALEQLDSRFIGEPDVLRFDPGLHSLISVNTPEDLIAARAMTGTFANAGG